MTFKEMIDSPKSWKQDYSHENGQYLCTCIYCKSDFLGHKRRIVCRECANKKEENKQEQTENIQPKDNKIIIVGGSGHNKESLCETNNTYLFKKSPLMDDVKPRNRKERRHGRNPWD